MDINCLIFFLCLYQTVQCIQVKKDNDNDGDETDERIRKLGSYGWKERNNKNQNIDYSIDQRKYLDSLMQNTIKNVATVTNMTEDRQQYIMDLRNKYVQFMNALNKVQTMNGDNLMISFDEHQYDKRNIHCGGKNCSINNFRDKNRPQQRPYNRTVTWQEHRALKYMFLNTTRKCIEQMFGNIEIAINVERRKDDFYIWAIIPQKVVNETAVGVEPIKSDISIKSRIIKDEYASFDNKTENEKFENSIESMIATNVSTITLSNLPEFPTLATWWNSIWFWMIHFIALILFIILVLSCFIWHFGSSNKHSDYIRI